MVDLVTRFKKWLLHKRQFSVAWFSRDHQQTHRPQDVFDDLPDDVSRALFSAANALPIPPCEQETVIEAVREAMADWTERWEQRKRASGSIVVLAHPVTAISRILTESLEAFNTDEDALMNVSLLDWPERPLRIETIKKRLRAAFDGSDTPEEANDCAERDKQEQTGQAQQEQDQNQSKQAQPRQKQPAQAYSRTLAIIPNLGWCFLRSADGLDGIDYLQEALLEDSLQTQSHNHAHFWVIGSGQVGWDYLKSTLSFDAYCGGVVCLPKLTGEQLESWLSPIVKQFGIEFNDVSIHKRFSQPQGLFSLQDKRPTEVIADLSQEVSATVQSSLEVVKDELLLEDDQTKEENPKEVYFNRLANISDGVSAVALQLFTHSLKFQSGKGIIATTPKLPALPDLKQDDLYLLYSLMLHGDLTVRSLAKSLGDPPQVVNSRVQVLRNVEIIKQKGNVLKLNPIHYPKLRRELKRNNFVIDLE